MLAHDCERAAESFRWRMVVSALRLAFWTHDRNPDSDLRVDDVGLVVRGRLPAPVDGAVWFTLPIAARDVTRDDPREVASRWYDAYAERCALARAGSRRVVARTATTPEATPVAKQTPMNAEPSTAGAAA